MPSWFKNITIIVIMSIITFALVEVSARFYLWNIASSEQFNHFASFNQLRDYYGGDVANRDWSHVPHRFLGYVPAPNYENGLLSHNSLGFRGDEITIPKPDETFRIVALGGSTTYSVLLNDNAQTYTALLQKELRERGYSNIEIVNAGVNGYPTLNSLINLETRVLDLDPDMLLIYHAINDVHVRLVWPPEVYRSDLSGSGTMRLRDIKMPTIWEYSTALRMVGIYLGIFQSHNTLDVNFIDQTATNYFMEFNEQNFTYGNYPSGIFEEVSAQEMLETNKPIYYERNLRNMVNIALDNDIVPILIGFAYTPMPDRRTSTSEYQFALQEHNETMERVADNYNVPFYDLEANMPEGETYYFDGIHFTATGNQVRAEFIADFLIEQDVLP
jgi:lysophospholipase L1-like esterase